FEVGETVIPNCFFSDSRENGTGIPTNFASMGWLKIHKNKIITSPKNLTHNEAAGFSLGAQTATAMIRKINILNTGGTPLVFSARST
ncbi:zinc-binding alcohol dehydrogenase family protein, partial [Staphylococcus aureus]|nr:zinc-binding alcohol dehydrogenase family protein [Staphylococcus aureus]